MVTKNRNHGNRTTPPPHLLLRYDNLRAEGILGVRNGMVHQTNAPDHLPRFPNPFGNVGRVAIDLFTLGDFTTAPNPADFSFRVHDDLVDLLVQHVGPAVDGG